MSTGWRAFVESGGFSVVEAVDNFPFDRSTVQPWFWVLLCTRPVTLTHPLGPCRIVLLKGSRCGGRRLGERPVRSLGAARLAWWGPAVRRTVAEVCLAGWDRCVVELALSRLSDRRRWCAGSIALSRSIPLCSSASSASGPPYGVGAARWIWRVGFSSADRSRRSKERWGPWAPTPPLWTRSHSSGDLRIRGVRKQGPCRRSARGCVQRFSWCQPECRAVVSLRVWPLSAGRACGASSCARPKSRMHHCFWFID